MHASVQLNESSISNVSTHISEFESKGIYGLGEHNKKL